VPHLIVFHILLFWAWWRSIRLLRFITKKRILL